MPEVTHATTTAAVLNSFRKELLEGGFSVDEVAHLASVALGNMLSSQGEPLVVRGEVSA